MKTQTLKILEEILENALLDQLDMRHELNAKFISEVRKTKLTTELKKTEQFIDTVKNSIKWVSSAREPNCLIMESNDKSIKRDRKALNIVAVMQRSEQLPCERCKKMEFMIENGLGWKDMENDCT